MNFHQPRERVFDGKHSGIWDYTCYNDNQNSTRPEGYCAGWPAWADQPYDPYKDGLAFGDADRKAAEVARMAVHRAKYHTNGHASKDECYACHKEYVLDNQLTLHSRPESEAKSLERCRICHKFCSNQARVGSWFIYPLCDEHLNRESVEKLYESGSTFGSD